MFKYWVINYLPWVLSAISIYSMILVGNKHKNSWLVGLANQFLWLTWILISGSWGFLPMNIAIWIVYTRNHFKWANEAASTLKATVAAGVVESDRRDNVSAHGLTIQEARERVDTMQGFDNDYLAQIEKDDLDEHFDAALTKEETDNPYGQDDEGYQLNMRGESIIPTYDLLMLPPQTEPVYLVVESRDYRKPGEMKYKSKTYFYEEHTCPTNWLPSVEMIAIKGDFDPHGLFEYLCSIDRVHMNGALQENIEQEKIDLIEMHKKYEGIKKDGHIN